MNKETVILLHGITRSNLDMLMLKNRLSAEGYHCLNMQYPSTKHPIGDLSTMVHKALEREDRYTGADKVHFVGHSMGGLVTRHILAKNRPDNLGAVVMMGTPNKGSEMANYAADHRLLSKVFNRMFGPAGHQLRTDHQHLQDEIIDYPLGIIASNISLNPLANRVFKAPNDSLVTVENTKLEGMDDHIIIPSTHIAMPFDPRIITQVTSFLKEGAFDHDYKTKMIRAGELNAGMPSGPGL